MNKNKPIEAPEKPKDMTDDEWHEYVFYHMNDVVKERKERALIERDFNEFMEKWIEELNEKEKTRPLSEL